MRDNDRVIQIADHIFALSYSALFFWTEHKDLTAISIKKGYSFTWINLFYGSFS